MIAHQWFPGLSIQGVLRIPAGTVDASATRGIKYDRPERHVVNTPFGQLEITAGDWVIKHPSGNYYVLKDVDYYGPRTKKSWMYCVVNKLKDAIR